jgi:2-dehydro-3-deoxy-D-arabinonate dehydratase
VTPGGRVWDTRPYEQVYAAERPELYFKAAPGRVRGLGEPVGIRADSGWDVPEPELAVVADAGGRIVGYMSDHRNDRAG